MMESAEHTHPGIESRLERIEDRLTSMSVEIGLILDQLNTVTRTTAHILALLRERGTN
jgi:hypothetical protein